MLFFLNDNLQTNKSGIEHAQIKRQHLFNKFNSPAKIVTRQYSNELHKITQAAGVEDQDFINLFDYFQEALMVEYHPKQIQELAIDPSWRRQADGVNYNYYAGKHRVMYVRRDKRYHHVLNQQYFDRFGKLVKVAWFDYRGFLSVDQLYDWSNQITVQNYYRPDGSLAIQTTKTLNKREKEQQVYHLVNYRGRDYQFTNFDDLTRFFYDELVTDPAIVGDQKVGLIVDRSYELGWAVLNMHHRVSRWLQLHNNHLNNGDDIMNSPLNYNYTWGLNHAQDWDGIIALTPQQAADVAARFAKETRVLQIPGPIVPDEVLKAPRVPFEQRRPGLVVVVARLSAEKQQDQLLQVWPQIKAAVPTAELELWGYANDHFDDKLKELVDQLQIKGSVHFKGYTSDVAQVYDQAQVMVLPSRAEGLPLSLVEGQSHGVAIVANDIKYGPAAVVIDGQDGYLTQNGDGDGLAKAIIDLLSHPDKLRQFSARAYQDSERYSEANVMQLWKNLISIVEGE